MKNLFNKPMIVLLLFFCACFNLQAQEKINGVVLNMDAAKYLQSAGYNFLKIANDGTTKPANGYKMFYNKNDKSVLISKIFQKTTKENKKLMIGGIQFFCSGCEEESCVLEKTTKEIEGNTISIRYDCLGCFTENNNVLPCEGSMLMQKAVYRKIL